MSTTDTHRDAVIPGLGRIKIPAGMTEKEVAAQIAAADEEATPVKKAKKKP